MCVYAPHACQGKPEEGIGAPETEVTDHCDQSCGFWRLNPGPLKESNVLSTTEPSLQPQ